MVYHEISFLSYFGDRNMHFFGKSDWPAENSRKACRQSPTHDYVLKTIATPAKV